MFDVAADIFQKPLANFVSLLLVMIAMAAWGVGPVRAECGPLVCKAAPIPGDADGNGNVNAADVDAVRELILTESATAPADCNLDGLVNVLDLICVHGFILVPPPLDPDGDGLNNDQEAIYGSDPANPDSDGDGLCDGLEVNEYGTAPTNPDSDGDGFSDFFEVAQCTEPLDPGSFPLEISFVSSGQRVREGVGTVEVAVTLNQPLADAITLKFQIGGTAGAIDFAAPDEIPLPAGTPSGEFHLDVTVEDDGDFEELEWIDLLIDDADDEFVVGDLRVHRIVLEDNDSVWEVGLQTGSESVGFSLEIRQVGDTTTASVFSRGDRLIPKGDAECMRRTAEGAAVNLCWPVENVVLTNSEFRVATAPNGITFGATGLLPMETTFRFALYTGSAPAGWDVDDCDLSEREVSEDLIRGCLSKTLNSGGLTLPISGRFAMARRPPMPSTSLTPLRDSE